MLQGDTQYSGLFHSQRDPTVVWVQSCYKSKCVIGMFACGIRGKRGGGGGGSSSLCSRLQGIYLCFRDCNFLLVYTEKVLLAIVVLVKPCIHDSHVLLQTEMNWVPKGDRRPSLDLKKWHSKYQCEL